MKPLRKDKLNMYIYIPKKRKNPFRLAQGLKEQKRKKTFEATESKTCGLKGFFKEMKVRPFVSMVYTNVYIQIAYFSTFFKSLISKKENISVYNFTIQYKP